MNRPGLLDCMKTVIARDVRIALRRRTRRHCAPLHPRRALALHPGVRAVGDGAGA